MSKLSLSQSIDIRLMNNTENIYKGLKQNEYLKDRLTKTIKNLDSCNRLNLEYEKFLGRKEEILYKQTLLIKNLEEDKSLEIQLRENNIKALEVLNSDLKKEVVRKSKNNFLKGMGVGIGIGVISIASLLIINH